MKDQEFEFSDADAGAIRTFGEEPAQKALVPEVVDSKNKAASDAAGYVSGTASVAMAVLDRGQALQQVKTQYVTAVTVQKPRDIGKIQEAVLREAAIAGAAFFYNWIVKTKDGPREIEDISIDAAMCYFRNYGNCVLDNSVIVDETHFNFTASIVDLEHGTTFNRLYRQRRGQATGNMNKDRAEDIAFQIGQSKADRNAINKYMPEWLKEQILDTAKKGELNKIDPKKLPETRQLAVKFFSSKGATQVRMEKALGKPLDKWMAEEILVLRGNMTGLKEGRVTIDELFPPDGITEKQTTQEQTKKDLLPTEQKPKPGDDKETGSDKKGEGNSGAPPVKTQAPSEAEKPNEGKTKKTKKTEKTAEPPAQETAPPPTEAPKTEIPKTAVPLVAVGNEKDLMAQAYDPKNIRLGIVTCPVSGMRAGKKTHTNYCMNTCKQAPACVILRQGPQAAV